MTSSAISNLQVDPPVELRTNGSLLDRRYIDDQIIGIEQHLVDSLLTVGCRWFVVDSSVTGTLSNPTCVAMSGTDTSGNPTVIKATSTNAKYFLGIALTSAQALSKLRVVVSGVLPPSVTGIVNGGVAGYAIVNTTTGLPEFATTITSADTVVGRVNVAGMLTVLGANINYTSAGAESTPTGTGFRHVTGGTEDGAAALVVNADVNAAAGIVGSKLAANLAITTSIAAGTSPAATGAVRIPKNTAITARNSIDTADYTLIQTNGSDAILVGDVGANSLAVQTFSAGNIYLRMGANDTLVVYAASLRAVQPITGEDVGYSSPYGVHGTATVAEGDTTRTEVAGVYKYTNIIYTGAMTAGRTVTFPLPGSLAASYHKAIYNNTTGGFSITLANGGGAVVAVAAGKTALLAFEPAGVRRLTADV